MIYLTNDTLDQAVYFEPRGCQPRRRGGEVEHVVYGLLGNGVTEVPVTVKSGRGHDDMVFGRDDLFRFVEERTIRRMIADAVREMAWVCSP